MRLPASEKLEIIGLVEQSHLPARRTLQMLGIKSSTFYRWYDRFRSGGPEALEDKPPKPDHEVATAMDAGPGTESSLDANGWDPRKSSAAPVVTASLVRYRWAQSSPRPKAPRRSPRAQARRGCRATGHAVARGDFTSVEAARR